ncbi:hypothetical protein TNCV_4954461 [Trichonephila clavipes]|nr:hypothetical protein TNCV_4954461 [Trichonephila clavipes]
MYVILRKEEENPFDFQSSPRFAFSEFRHHLEPRQAGLYTKNRAARTCWLGPGSCTIWPDAKLSFSPVPLAASSKTPP